jgi:hypothetical protein
MNQDLMQKLVVAKQIMDVHNKTPRQNTGGMPNTPSLASYNPVPASYNIPQEYLAEQPKPQAPKQQNIPTQDRIINSKLPDEIKKLMLEHPIEQPKMMGSDTVLSDELVEAASRLMNTDASGKQVRQPSVQRQPQGQSQGQIISENVLDNKNLRSMFKEIVREVLSEQGVITESTQKAKEHISFRVGQHVFEGVITKIKKVK